MGDLDIPPEHPPPPPPPAPKRLSRPKITLQIPDSNVPTTPKTPRGLPTAMFLPPGVPRFYGKPPGTAGTQMSDPHGNPYFDPFIHMYHNKASDFMFKQFEGFKDFTMTTAKSGLSLGEKASFWLYNQLRRWSKKWFTHLFLTLCLALYSVMGAAIFMTLEGEPETEVKNITRVRTDIAVQIDRIWKNETLRKNNTAVIGEIESLLLVYENKSKECSKISWNFVNAMFYAGTIYSTIDLEKGMSEEGNENNKVTLPLPIPIIKADSETQTLGRLVTKSPDNKPIIMEPEEQKMSLRKRRTLSKNRGQATRQREKTPEPSRIPFHEDTTSDDEDAYPQRNSREIEADKTYEEMKRLVEEQSNVKDPVYDLDTDEILEQRAMAANERRRRSVSPFALPDKEREELCKLERKGSFTDPHNKLLSTNYTLSPKEEDTSRRNSLTIEPPRDIRKNSLTPPTPTSSSPIQKDMSLPLTTTPKKLEKIVYPDEVNENTAEEKSRKLKTPVTKAEVFTFDEKESKPSSTAATNKVTETTAKVSKGLDTTTAPGELVTKVIQVERTPSKKLAQENKPVVEIRERIVRTPSRKMTTDAKPVLKQQPPAKPAREEPQSKVPPVKPVRSKSATRFGSKTSESEMSEDQHNVSDALRRKVVPTPRRFLRNKSPRAKRSHSVARVEDVKVIDKSGISMSQTGQEIIELMQARARSLSIPKDDPKLLPEYKSRSKKLQTPNRTPSMSRTSRGISCPKTIQIISDKEVLSGLTPKIPVIPVNKKVDREKHRRRSSGYLDASQSEYTSSCYSSSPSENEFDFDLSERTAELTRKLNILSQEAEKRESVINGSVLKDDAMKKEEEPSTILRKRVVTGNQSIKSKETSAMKGDRCKETNDKNKPTTSKWKIVANWQMFKREQKKNYESLIYLRNRCINDMLLLIIMFGLGGMMFRSLEGSFENAYKCSTRNVKRDFIEHLWRGSHHLREEDWKSMARKKLYEFENQLHTAHEAGVTSYSGQRSWNFMNSFVYCMTLITTIGYGHIAPKTFYGRVATIIYAIIGIPLFLIVLADFGKLFTRIIKFFWAFIRRFYYTRSCRKVRRTVPVQGVMKGLNVVYDVVRRPSQIFNEEDMQGACDQPGGDHPPPIVRRPSDLPPPLPPKPGTLIVKDLENETEPDTPAPTFEIDDEFNLPISVAIVILLMYIIIGAVVYKQWEGWEFFDSFYFVFISMSTIGLGDLVPNHPIFMMCSIIYLVFGLALTSMCINVVQVKLSDTFKQASAKLGATIGLKVAEEDGSLVPITPPPTEDVPVHKSKKDREEMKEEINKDNKSKDDAKNR